MTRVLITAAAGAVLGLGIVLLVSMLNQTIINPEELKKTVDDSYESDALTLDVWLEDDRIPVRADIFWDNRKIVSLVVESFALS